MNEYARQLVTQAESIVFFTGAGISAESGISTFRDPETGALWSRFDPDVMSSMRGFKEDPYLVWDWYDALREKIISAKPNYAHEVIGRLCGEKQVTVVTQNIDDLHERGGASNVIHLHGGMQVRCTMCKWRGERNELVAGYMCNPRGCPDCKSMTRPDVVWFGEKLPTDAFLTAKQKILEADLLIVIGTSGQVQPAASLANMAYGRTLSINTRDTDHVSNGVKLTGKASEILRQLVG